MIPDLAGVISAAGAALHTLERVNPVAGALALLIIAMVLALLVFGRSHHAFEEVASESRHGKFQQQLLDELKAMRDREGLLRDEIKEMRAQNARLADALGEQRVQIELLRGQTRRLIDMLRDVRDGRLAPAQIAVPEASA